MTTSNDNASTISHYQSGGYCIINEDTIVNHQAMLEFGIDTCCSRAACDHQKTACEDYVFGHIVGTSLSTTKSRSPVGPASMNASSKISAVDLQQTGPLINSKTSLQCGSTAVIQITIMHVNRT
jgi:hypothetical protein